MPRRDVSDLVAEHSRELRLVIEERQDAARDVDEAARQRERVDRGLIHDRELPRQGGRRRPPPDEDRCSLTYSWSGASS